MVVSKICLTDDDIYVDMKGKSPMERAFDRDLLRALCEGQVISPEAIERLPSGIVRTAEWDNTVEPTVGITIREIEGLTDLLIVSRSLELIDRGKKFRFDSFELIVKDRKIELWKRRRHETVRG